jgi:hypothetical protein
VQLKRCRTRRSDFQHYQRKELERQCRYITRPTIANERLKRNGESQVVLPRRHHAHRYVTARVHAVFGRHGAATGLHQIRLHGVLAPNARLRAAIVPGAADKSSEHVARSAHEAPARMNWARLLKRAFDIDLERRPHCEGDLKIIAASKSRR